MSPGLVARALQPRSKPRARRVFPAEMSEHRPGVQRGDAGETQRLDAEMKPLWDLFKEFSSFRVVYAAVEVLGLCKAQPPRPILPLPDATRSRFEAALKRVEAHKFSRLGQFAPDMHLCCERLRVVETITQG